ncbi:MAG: Hsp20/alpha crystallin family protein [Desulfurella sp.]|uniref:Hsp20/alpha crystallin family protein n=1 Tax=Desulfurella sp. TaxID=1962857 RepID=UPI003CA11F3E
MNTNKVIFFAYFFALHKNASSDSILADMYEEDGKVYIELEIPDLEIDTLTIEKNYPSLVISGFKKKKAKNNATYFRAERIFGYFKKFIDLPFHIEDVSEVNYNNGILEIILERF